MDGSRSFRGGFRIVRDIGRGFEEVGDLGCFIISFRVSIRGSWGGSLGGLGGLCIIGLVAYLNTLILVLSSHPTPQTDSSTHTK